MNPSTKDVRDAVVARIVGDATIMAKLGGVPPFLYRLPKGSPHGETVAAITVEADTTTRRGRQGDAAVTMSVWAFTSDLAQAVVEDLWRLFHGDGRWVRLTVPAGRVAYCRVEAETDLPDPDSELVRKVVRLRVRHAG